MNATLNGAHLDTALPNKAYEYLGCGLPVITLRPGHRALCRLLSEHGVGLALDDVAQLPDALAGLDLPALRRRVAAVRDELTFEANIDRLLALYDELTDTDSTGGSLVATSPQVAPASPEPNTSPEVAPK
jgi:glycosyltransferase involved in cell wall biosynthesis